MEENPIKKAQQALCEHLSRLKNIGVQLTLKPTDEAIITEAMVKTYYAILEEERLNKSSGRNDN